MEQFSFGIITPSYAPDFARCRLLSETIDKYISSPVKHYIVVDRQDLKLFEQLKGTNREIITVESILPWWIQKISLLKNGWFSFKTLPLRNWIIQQLVKLAIAEFVNDDILVFVDSDVAFVHSLDLQNFVQDGRVRLFREPGTIKVDTEPLAQWCDVGNKLLGLPPVNYPTANYLGNIITWQRDNVFKLHRHLEKISGRGWIETIASSWQLSEYMLYGIFSDLVLKENSPHYHDPQKICHNYWHNTPMSDLELNQFFANISPQHVAVMISAKAKMPVEHYAALITSVSEA